MTNAADGLSFTVSHNPAVFTPRATFPHPGNGPIASLRLISTNGPIKRALGRGRRHVKNVAGCLIGVIIYVVAQIRQPDEFWERKPFYLGFFYCTSETGLVFYFLFFFKHGNISLFEAFLYRL